jgi:hypothetical protein
MNNFNFKQWLEASQSNITTTQQALQTLQLHPNPTTQQIKKAYWTLSKQNHPDQGGTQKQQTLLNAAYEYLQTKHQPNNEPPHEYTHQEHDLPPWQTDPRAGYNQVGKDYRDINYCKKKIYEHALTTRDPLEKWTIWAWDGHHFRGSFTVFCNTKTLGYAGAIMEQWNSYGTNSYDTQAVLANRENEKELTLIRLNQQDTTHKKIKFTHDSFNNNPSNDTQFTQKLKHHLNQQN